LSPRLHSYIALGQSEVNRWQHKQVLRLTDSIDTLINKAQLMRFKCGVKHAWIVLAVLVNS